MGGDQLEMAITAESETQVLLTTAAAHKIYRSQGDWAQQTIQLKVKAGAFVEWRAVSAVFKGGFGAWCGVAGVGDYTVWTQCQRGDIENWAVAIAN